MPEREKLAVVIPTLMEAENLGFLLARVRRILDGTGRAWEVIVVDDDSGDGTDAVVSAISREDPRVRLLVRRGERGLSGAILHGWQHTDAAILGVMDADGQHPAELLPLLAASICAGHDLAIGSRYAQGGRRHWNPVRGAISRLALLAALPLQSPTLRVRDPLSGFFMVRRHCLGGLPFKTREFKLLLEILVRGRVQRIEEIPFSFEARRAGRSKAGLGVARDYVAMLARLYAARYGIFYRL